MQHCKWYSVQCSAAQCRTVQHCAVQYSTMQCSAASETSHRDNCSVEGNVALCRGAAWPPPTLCTVKIPHTGNTEYLDVCEKCHVLGVRSDLSCVMFHVSPVTCHISLTATVTDPPPANSPTMHSRMLLLILT